MDALQTQALIAPGARAQLKPSQGSNQSLAQAQASRAKAQTSEAMMDARMAVRSSGESASLRETLSMALTALSV